MSLAKQIIVRHRSKGHVRFSLPRELRTPLAGMQLKEGLRKLEGVRCVDLYPREGKISIRYFENVIDLKSLAHSLAEIVCAIEVSDGAGAKLPVNNASDDSVGESQASANNYGPVRTIPGALASLFRKSAEGKSILTADREQIVLDFCTDLLVLYLIKLHWHLIMSHWIRQPWRFRGEWAATLYLIFLLVRSKK